MVSGFSSSLKYSNRMKMASRTSPAQFEIMLNFFERFPKLLSGKVDPTFSKVEKENRWEDLSTALNAEGKGPARAIESWRKTLKDWKCYVKRKAGRIALQQKQTGGGPPGKEELTAIEQRLLGMIGEVAAHGQPSVLESSISGFSDANTSTMLDESIDIDAMDPHQDIQNYCGNRKAIKRKIKNSLAAEVSEKLIRSQNETNSSQRRMAEVAEKKLILMEQQAALLERRTVAAEKKAKAKEQLAEANEQLVLLQERNLQNQWRSKKHEKIHVMRMKKLQYL